MRTELWCCAEGTCALRNIDDRPQLFWPADGVASALGLVGCQEPSRILACSHSTALTTSKGQYMQWEVLCILCKDGGGEPRSRPILLLRLPCQWDNSAQNQTFMPRGTAAVWHAHVGGPGRPASIPILSGVAPKSL